MGKSSFLQEFTGINKLIRKELVTLKYCFSYFTARNG